MDYYSQSWMLAQETRNRKGEGMSLANIGIILLKIEQYSEALKYLHLALEIFIQFQNSRGQELVLVKIGKAYCALGEYSQALAYNRQHLTMVQAKQQLVIS
jgi:tetratricopeptide (TPR) repeat protein